MSTPLITLEEHYFSKSIARQHGPGQALARFPEAVVDKLKDLGDKRIADMDVGKVSLQVISHGPMASSMPAEVVAEANDELNAATKGRPSRLAGFAALPMTDPQAAVKELRRCVKELGFVGALLDNHLLDGRYYDGKEFWPVFEAAQELDVLTPKPLYLHPTYSVDSVHKALYDGDWEDTVSFSLSTSAWGWHSDVGLHVLRLCAAGVFDAFPSLKICIGHMGEMLPFMLDRVDQRSGSWMKGKKKSVLDVYKENIWITTASFFSVDPMACLLRNTRHDHIMYSVDYPFSQHEMGLGFLEKLRTSGLVSQEVFEGIAYKNAEKFLKVKAGPTVG